MLEQHAEAHAQRRPGSDRPGPSGCCFKAAIPLPELQGTVNNGPYPKTKGPPKNCLYPKTKGIWAFLLGTWGGPGIPQPDGASCHHVADQVEGIALRSSRLSWSIVGRGPERPPKHQKDPSIYIYMNYTVW